MLKKITLAAGVVRHLLLTASASYVVYPSASKTLSVTWKIPSQQAKGYLLQQLSGYAFYDKVLWNVSSSSKTQCQMKCLQNILCLTFTFWGRSPQGQCMGLSKVPSADDSSKTAVKGARSYVLVKKFDGAVVGIAIAAPTGAAGYSTTRATILNFHVPCSKMADCKVANGGQAACVERQCQCTVGSFYSVSKSACIKSCNRFNDVAFTKSVGNRHDTDMESNLFYDDDSQDSCTSSCVQMPECVAVSYDAVVSPHCVGLGADAMAPNPIGRDEEEDSPTVYFQKMCF